MTVNEASVWMKLGNHTMAVKGEFNDKDDAKKRMKNGGESQPGGFHSVTVYGQTQVNDNWKVATKLQPALSPGDGCIFGLK